MVLEIKQVWFSKIEVKKKSDLIRKIQFNSSSDFKVQLHFI